MDSMFQTLESRQLLSVDSAVMGPQPLPAGQSVVEWNGHHVQAVINSFVVTFDSAMGNDSADLVTRRLAAAAGGTVTAVRAFGQGRYVQLDATGLDAASMNSAIRQVNTSMSVGRVLGVDPNATFEPSRVPNDVDYTKQWHLENTGQSAAGSGNGLFNADINVVNLFYYS